VLLYTHHMWNELIEVPGLIRGLINNHRELFLIQHNILNIQNIIHIKLIASGSSYNVSLCGRFIFEEILGIPTTVEYASEFAHKNYAIDKNTLVIGISQSGKTADTLAALKKIKYDSGCQIFCITNVEDSPLFRLADHKILIGAGIEKAVPATKTFSLQLLALFNLALYLGKLTNKNQDKLSFIHNELKLLPDQLDCVLKQKEEIQQLAEILAAKEHLVFLSRGITWAIAREGALKYKETTCIDCNAYPAGEFIHGYMAILDEKYYILALDFIKDSFLRANLLKIKQNYNASIFALTMDTTRLDLFKSFISLPVTKTKLTATFVFAACLQMMAYFSSVSLGYNPDKPKNLSKYLSREN